MQTNDRNARVCPDCYEPEHPQKYPKIKAGDPKPLPNARPDPYDAAEPTYTCANQEITAGGGVVTFTVVKTARLDLASTLYWKTIPGSAWEERDFIKGSGVLNWAISDVNKTFNVTVQNLGLFAGQRVFTVALYGSSTSQIPILTAICTIGLIS